MPRTYVHLAILACFLLAVLPSEQHVVVWEFAARGEIKKEIVTSFTEEFEESLLAKGRFSILERRNVERLQAVIDKERTLQSAMEISPESVDTLKFLGVQMVVFGEVFDDVDSGDVRIGVSFQTFEGRTVLKQSVLMKRGRIADAEARKAAMEKLVGLLALPSRAVPVMKVDQLPAEDDPEGIIRTTELNNISRAAEKLIGLGKLKEALMKLEAFRQKYPDTPQAREAAAFIDNIRQKESEHE